MPAGEVHRIKKEEKRDAKEERRPVGKGRKRKRPPGKGEKEKGRRDAAAGNFRASSLADAEDTAQKRGKKAR